MSPWLLLGAFLLSILAGTLTALLTALVWGLGILPRLFRAQLDLAERLEDTNQRITTEVKRRAANTAVEARREARGERELVAEATTKLAEQRPSGITRDSSGKPSIRQVR